MELAIMKDVVKRFESLNAMDHVSFSVNQGEVLGLLGPNGAGKTTTIRSLAGLVSVDSGEITILGEKQNVNNIKLKQHIGLVTQELTVFEDLTAEENLHFFGGLYGFKGTDLKKRAKEALEFVGLSEHAKKTPGKFSGGMQRRLNIACALVHSPKFLIMDEPTVGIDPQSRNYILESVKKLATKGVTVLYTSHYMEEVESIATRIVVMDSGRVIISGTLQELIERIQHEETIKITVVNNAIDLIDKFKAIQGIKNVIRNGADYTIISSINSGNLNRILEIAQQNGGVSNIVSEKPTLEDVFLTLTGKKLRDKGEEA